MVYQVVTTLTPDEIFARARCFFAERVPNQAAFPEREGPGFLVMRGQGGEEIAIAAATDASVTRVRASTLFFDHALDRFLASLPVAVEATP
jgi:hypothetical protein